MPFCENASTKEAEAPAAIELRVRVYAHFVAGAEIGVHLQEHS
jgi:cytochrome c-type biogenesis protein CcmH/NrfF